MSNPIENPRIVGKDNAERNSMSPADQLRSAWEYLTKGTMRCPECNTPVDTASHQCPNQNCSVQVSVQQA